MYMSQIFPITRPQEFNGFSTNIPLDGNQPKFEFGNFSTDSPCVIKSMEIYKTVTNNGNSINTIHPDIVIVNENGVNAIKLNESLKYAV